jgi:imidazole glycerol-phosphate synthase subunit HisH
MFAIERLGYKAVLSNNPDEIKSADKVIFPGVGEASYAMRMLKQSGLDSLIPTLTQPVLGICLGMQFPQMGWNTIYNLKSDLFKGIAESEYMYLVHSFYAPMCKETIATTKYELEYSSALENDNFYGTQFHPEKSGDVGEQILNNFLKI